MIQTINPLSGYQYQANSLNYDPGKFLSICPVPVTPFEKEAEDLRKILKTENDLCKIASLRNICLYNLGYPRNKMPQLDAKVLTAYVENKTSKGFLVDRTSYHPSNLEPVQREINLPMVLELIHKFYEGSYDPCRDPILVADEPKRVVDGHHRYAACKKLNRAIDVVHVHDKIQNVLRELRHFAGVESYEIER